MPLHPLFLPATGAISPGARINCFARQRKKSGLGNKKIGAFSSASIDGEGIASTLSPFFSLFDTRLRFGSGLTGVK